MVHGLPSLEHVDQICDACLAGKQRRNPFPEQARRHVENILDQVHGDLCGPVTPMTPSGNKFFLLLVDDLSRYMWLVLLPSKDHAASAIKNFQAGIEVETGRKLKALRTDRGGGEGGIHLRRIWEVLRRTRHAPAAYRPLLHAEEQGG